MMVKPQPYMSGKDNKAIVDGLTGLLADNFVLYFKTHTFHWNVEGEHFKALHEMFEGQYNDLWAFNDELAERIRALDSYAPISLDAIKKRASLSETGQLPDAKAMVHELANDNTEMVNLIFPVLRAAQEAGDEATTDMLIGRVQVHEKAAWMLRSLLK